ncbi:MAG TPA: hypothetical protein VF060_27425 [Trebonia sp.]
MAQSEPRAVLTVLNERPATGFYWWLSLPATVGRFLLGYDTPNIGSALNFADIIKLFGERETPPAPDHTLQHD